MLILLSVLMLTLPIDGSDASVARSAGDAAFARMDYKAAVPAYELALRVAPNDPEVLWRAARAYVCLGELEEGAERDAAMKKAEAAARFCIRLDSTRSEGHSWLAGALGYIALDAPASLQVGLVREILLETQKATALNPADDVAYSVRGSTYRALGNIGWLKRQLAKLFYGDLPDGGFVEAEEALQRAIALAPDVMRHSYELGILYMDMGKPDEARLTLERARTLPVRVGIDLPRLRKIEELLSGFK